MKGLYMKRRPLPVIFILFTLVLGVVFSGVWATHPVPEKHQEEQKDDRVHRQLHRQLIVWSSGDRDVAIRLVFLYALNCSKHKWMDHVRLLVWGPSAKLLSVDSELQEAVGQLKKAGVELWACKACADSYGVSDKLASLGIKVHYTGKLLAEMQKDGWHVLNF